MVFWVLSEYYHSAVVSGGGWNDGCRHPPRRLKSDDASGKKRKKDLGDNNEQHGQMTRFLPSHIELSGPLDDESVVIFYVELQQTRQ